MNFWVLSIKYVFKNLIFCEKFNSSSMFYSQCFAWIKSFYKWIKVYLISSRLMRNNQKTCDSGIVNFQGIKHTFIKNNRVSYHRLQHIGYKCTLYVRQFESTILWVNWKGEEAMMNWHSFSRYEILNIVLSTILVNFLRGRTMSNLLIFSVNETSTRWVFKVFLVLCVKNQ